MATRTHRPTGRSFLGLLASVGFPILFALSGDFTPAAAQTTASLRVGGGGGTTGVAALEGALGRTFSERLRVEATAYGLGAISACDDPWPQSFACGFGGVGLSVGPSLVILGRDGWSWRGGVGAGGFHRTADGFEDATSLTWDAGTDVAIALGDRIALQIALRFRQINDPLYDDLFGEGVSFTTLTAGVSGGR